jgi:hypothetical protein
MATFLDDLPPIDWSDLMAASAQTQSALRRLGADKKALRELVYAVETTPRLLAKCEKHALDDKIVIYDDLERGFRIRLRLATSDQHERAHQHRFSFSTLILRGMYHQAWYYTDQVLDENVDVAAIRPVCLRDEPAGSAFTIHHNVIHATMADPDTISLIMRGPAAKDRAIITHKETGRVWFRYGEKDESEERRKKVQMPLETYLEWRNKMEGYGLI